jgi:hypothetical protein
MLLKWICANCGNTDQDGSDICIDCGQAFAADPHVDHFDETLIKDGNRPNDQGE